MHRTGGTLCYAPDRLCSIVIATMVFVSSMGCNGNQNLMLMEKKRLKKLYPMILSLVALLFANL